jgi:hypothetical protein
MTLPLAVCEHFHVSSLSVLADDFCLNLYCQTSPISVRFLERGATSRFDAIDLIQTTAKPPYRLAGLSRQRTGWHQQHVGTGIKQAGVSHEQQRSRFSNIDAMQAHQLDQARNGHSTENLEMILDAGFNALKMQLQIFTWATKLYEPLHDVALVVVCNSTAGMPCSSLEPAPSGYVERKMVDEG